MRSNRTWFSRNADYASTVFPVLGVLALTLTFSTAGVAFGQSTPTTSATTTTSVTTTTVPLVTVDKRGNLLTPKTLGQGQLHFDPAGTTRPKSSTSFAVNIAVKSLRARPRNLKPEAFFAFFSATSPAKRNVDGTTSPIFMQRPVWVVRFANVPGRRQSGVVSRKNAPTTTSLEVTTEIVVIVDDVTKKVLLTTEYLPDT